MVVSCQPPLPPGNTPDTYFCRPRGHSAIGRILCQRKLPMTPAGIFFFFYNYSTCQQLQMWSLQVGVCSNVIAWSKL